MYIDCVITAWSISGIGLSNLYVFMLEHLSVRTVAVLQRDSIIFKCPLTDSYPDNKISLVL